MLNLRGDTDTGESYEELAQKFIEIVSKELHMQIIMVTHDRDLAKYANKIIMIKDGVASEVNNNVAN